MVPVVALIGRPNAGESTSFNRLTRTRDALVAGFPGLTRDRKYDRTGIEGHEFICIDAGGIDGTEDGVRTHMAGQSLLAIEEADTILFMVDARSGLMLADEAIAKRLRSREESTFLVVSKIDGLDLDQAAVDFYAPGLGEACPIAAFHSHGVLSLLEHVLLPWMGSLAPQEEIDEGAEYWARFEAKENSGEEEEGDFDPQGLPVRLVIVGHPNIGKSALTSRILGEERVVVYDTPGTTRNSIYIPMEHDGREHVLIDTAGIRKRGKITDAVEKFSVIKTLQATEDINAATSVIDAREGISDQDLSLLGFILNSGRLLVIIASKWDDLSQEVKGQAKEALDFRLGFIDLARVHFISALYGNGVGNLFESICEAYDSSTRRVGTFTPTRTMTMAVEDHQPPLVRGRHVKLKYAHARGYDPLIVVIHGNQMKDLPDSYKRYLMDYSRKSLDVMGPPIRIQLKEGENPHANKRSTLTPTQMRKCKRLMKHIKKSK